uniref:KIB1-4 beta-propeller domain-containing protein n=1 Tax=Setaria italica TaxID=4555 RepID=K3ZFJ7_SETIT
MAVCRQWRLAAQQQQPPPRRLPPALPLLLSQRTFRIIPGGERLRFMLVPGNLGRCYGCFDDWLLFLLRPPYERNHRTCFLVNPISRATITTIPLCFDDGRPMAVFPMTKIIVCSPDLVASIIGHNSSVAFYRSGAASWSACAPDPRNRGWYVDIALYRGRLYALNGKEQLFAHELRGGGVVEPPEQLASRAVRRVVRAQPPPAARRDTALPRRVVWEDADAFLMILLLADLVEGVKMKVFEADLEIGRWLEVDDLNGQALFVSPGSSKALRLSGTSQMFAFIFRDMI